jgi:dipeptidyl-peptidase-4
MLVYGGPGAGNVYDEWNTSLAETYWAQQGVIQVAADNRSSGHFGKKGMDYIYRQAGIYETEDFMAVGRWLKKQPWVHPTKLCMTGFSSGGYITMMALTYGADVFDYGVAYYGTTDWRWYDTPYAERYMSSPAANPEGYNKTAVNTYAHQYKGMLRIIHGLSDNNVHPQNSLEVANKLQELGKHFEFMFYPGVKHGFTGKK